MQNRKDFISKVQEALTENSFVKLTLSKPYSNGDELQTILARPVSIKDEIKIGFNFKYKTKDETKNHTRDQAISELDKMLEHTFKNATLCTLTEDVILLTSKKGKTAIQKKSADRKIESTNHDHQKRKRSQVTAPYLQLLGITDHEASLVPKMSDKFRQINKFLEVIEGLIQSSDLTKSPRIIDMGSGKGYLTFALYDYLIQNGYSPEITGIELRKDLVEFCNKTAKQLDFKKLNFIDQPIQDYSAEKMDVLIALHACDTATDDALAKGVAAKANLLITAPCCHKQVRQSLKGKPTTNPLLKHGIFKERQYEMVTDTIRALILEREGYESKIFEFVSNEHTRKNIMLVGINRYTEKNRTSSSEKIESIKKEFGIEFQQLERLIQ